MTEHIDFSPQERFNGMPEVEITVYSYGGCTSCGNSMWSWFAKQNLKVKHNNVQIDYVSQEATKLAMDQGFGVRDVHFPMIIANGKVIIGFQPDTILAEVNKIREGL